MIYGIGVDLVYIPRVMKLLERWGERFRQRIFTEREIKYSFSKKLFQYELAARIGAKEAFAKALGLGWRQGLRWKDVEVVNLNTGQPVLNLYGRAQEICNEIGIKNCFVSLTHDRDYAVAVVILEKFF
ncbi:MAG: Holo-[acyl-carrier-protein] synthase [Candidatus Methanoperedenaceae archaeon GB50]|nr:MAG: Holo-[acyl-carrier-protein] synthase [Candidatus Methanoperedenaceae archaeon GB50]CAD7776691.1 Holo-[acyl-carrier-protein] synthase [Candidatus Methanoperedenaceae archaeon GB50]